MALSSISTIEWLSGAFFVATFISLCASGYLMTLLKSFPDEYEKIGSPSLLWPRMGYWSLSWYSVTGKFSAIPDARLVREFSVFRIFEFFRVALLLSVLVAGFH